MREIQLVANRTLEYPEKITLTVQGHKVTLSFSSEANCNIAERINKVLMGSYLQNVKRTI